MRRNFDTSPFSQQVRDDVFGIELMTIQNSMSPTASHPIKFLKNIPVEHCPNAFAVLIGLNTDTANITLSPSNNDNFNDHHQPPQSLFTLCYSGDTRPSPVPILVRECRNFSKTCGRNVSLLALPPMKQLLTTTKRAREKPSVNVTQWWKKQWELPTRLIWIAF